MRRGFCFGPAGVIRRVLPLTLVFIKVLRKEQEGLYDIVLLLPARHLAWHGTALLVRLPGIPYGMTKLVPENRGC